MKKGFTLAEVLVTLGIIGVVAALTTPALIQNVGNAKIGPRLQKAKATWEVATEMLLNEENSNSITGITTDAEEFGKKLSNHMKMTRRKHSESGNFDYSWYNKDGGHAHANAIKANTIEGSDELFSGIRFDTDDGMIYYIKKLPDRKGSVEIPAKTYITDVIIDINGAQKPNVVGKDTFFFELYNDGTLRPYGGRTARQGSLWTVNKHITSCNEDHVGYGFSCAGSIFDNGMKIIYQ